MNNRNGKRASPAVIKKANNVRSSSTFHSHPNSLEKTHFSQSWHFHRKPNERKLVAAASAAAATAAGAAAAAAAETFSNWSTSFPAFYSHRR